MKIWHVVVLQCLFWMAIGFCFVVFIWPGIKAFLIANGIKGL